MISDLIFLIFLILACAVVLLCALGFCTYQILGAIRDFQNAQISSEIATRTIIWKLRTGLYELHGRGFDERLREESDSRL